MSKVLEKLSLAGIIPVIKIEDASDAVPLCNALHNGGLPVAEITFRTDAAEQAIRNINKELPNILLGAGTVLTINQVDRAVAAGAKYIVSPGLNPKTVKHCQKLNVPIVAGCANPSDLELAIELGLETVKFFPAEALGGIKTIKAISAPFPQIRFIPTGGINDKNLLEYLGFDRVVACGGSWMVPSNLIANKDWNRIEELTSAAVNLMLGLELCHIGINSGTQEQAYQDAQTLANLMDISIIEHEKSFTIGKSFELMKTKGRGEKGNLAIFCNDVNRAVWHLAQKGFTFDETTRVVKGSKTISIYLKQEVADFAIYLLRK